MSVVPPAETLADALVRAADRGGGDIVFHLADGAHRLTPGQLLEAARARAADLAGLGISPRDAVGLVGPNHPLWAIWAHATWAAGAALVPLPAPVRVRNREAYMRQLHALSSAMGCRLIVADPRYLRFVPDGLGVAWDREQEATSSRGAVAGPGPDDVALLLCTSGSTAAPKGVVRTHRIMMARARRPETPGGEPERSLGWLPLFHAGGLAGGVIHPVLDGSEGHVLPNERFARDPREWLRLVGSVRATETFGPSSAWRVALRAAVRRPEGIDLSSLHRAGFGAEMVDPEVVDLLLEIGGRFGLRPEALSAGYGLSETGMVTVTPPGGGLRIDVIDLAELVMSGRAVAAGTGPAKRVASCGVPVPGVEVRIGGPDESQPERRVGEVLVRAPTVMQRYVGANASDPFVGDGWFRSGDLGYFAEGELFLTGRAKDVIIHLGRNYHPEDIEWAASQVAGVTGACAAFSPPAGGEGTVVLVIEAECDDRDGLSARIRQAVGDGVGLVPDEIVIVAPATLPRTESAKVQRGATRDAYARGELIPGSS